MARRSRESRASRRSREYDIKSEATVPPHSSSGHRHSKHLPRFNHNGHEVTPGIKPEGESGRRGIHPFKFLRICFRSSCRVSKWVNFLWPVVPAAIALHFARPDLHLAIFVLNYIAMIPAANLIGFAGQELGRKMPHVAGVILETTLGSVVELILFIVFVKKGDIQIVKAAILGSILANLLLCLGCCFIAGGFSAKEQEFHEAVSEAGSGLMLVAAVGLVVPAVFSNTVQTIINENETSSVNFDVADAVLKISRGTAIILLIAYAVYVFFQAKTHDNLYGEIFESDELKDRDRHDDLKKDKLTLTECIIALVIALTCVSLIAIFLVEQIFWVVEHRGISDAFLGLILVPLVEKGAEHLTAIDEAFDNQMNFALAHVLGASIQTALLNTPIALIAAWGLKVNLDLDFEIFDAVCLVLAVLVVGNFLRDGKSNYLEGALCVVVYVIIAICAYYFPNPPHSANAGDASASGGGEGGGGH